jgi:exosortase A-associated hydrolase 2
LTPSVCDARFIDGQRGRLFVLLRKPTNAASGRCVLIVPPFAEEMNKSRALFTDVAEALAARGVATLLPDLYGTGDSEGEFRDADAALWRTDLERSIAWSAAQGWPVTSMLAVRLGSILGAAAARSAGLRLGATVLWQPVLDGKRFLGQFLRLRVAASMMSDTGKESVEQLRAAMRDGALVEVAGYELGAALAEQLEQLNLAAELGAHLGRVHWIELIRDAAGAVSGASRSALEAARARGVDAVEQAVVGEPFWSSVEIVRNPQLVARTVDALSAGA